MTTIWISRQAGVGVHMHAIWGRHLYGQSELCRRKYTTRVQSGQHAPIYRTTKKWLIKEIVKCMYIDEPEILDAAIAKLPPELAEKYTLVKSTPFLSGNCQKTVSKGGCCYPNTVNLASKGRLTAVARWKTTAMLSGWLSCCHNSQEKNSRKSPNISTNQTTDPGVAYAIRGVGFKIVFSYKWNSSGTRRFCASTNLLQEFSLKPKDQKAAGL